MILTVMTPAYFPSVDVIARAMAADIVIWADTFLFNKHGHINRTLIKTITGAKWLTVPVFSKGGCDSPVHQMIIDNHTPWGKNHWKSIELNYKNAAYYYYHCDRLQNILETPHDKLEKLLYESFTFCLNKVSKVKPTASQLLPQSMDRTERAIAWLRHFNADTYLLPAFETGFMNIEKIKAEGFAIKTFSLPELAYFQQYADFIFPLSFLDLLLNEGEQSGKILKHSSIIQNL